RLTKIRRELCGRNSAKICRETWQRSARRDGRGSRECVTSCDRRVGRRPVRDHCVSSVPLFFPGAAGSTVKMLHLRLPVTVTQLSRAVPKHGRNQRAEPYYREYRADCVQTMPAITQQRPICWRGFGCSCPHLDVDRIDEDGPYKQHPCKRKQPSQGESEYRAPSAS